MIACLGRMPDASKAVPFGFQEQGSRVFHVGEFANTLAGSIYLESKGIDSPRIPEPNLPEEEKNAQALINAIETGLINACHDVSDGGLIIALAESAIANRIGGTIDHDKLGNSAATW